MLAPPRQVTHEPQSQLVLAAWRTLGLLTKWHNFHLCILFWKYFQNCVWPVSGPGMEDPKSIICSECQVTPVGLFYSMPIWSGEMSKKMCFWTSCDLELWPWIPKSESSISTTRWHQLYLFQVFLINRCKYEKVGIELRAYMKSTLTYVENIIQ